ncbi:MAG: hypothetical protein J6A47_03030 [Bacilli bacterium]|nr:hypothetical protein [Bacilli bacterium]MBO6285169.1 hypothetical protein [Bacilli bacterium]
MRDVREETPNKGESLFKTLAVAMIIAAVMSFVAMFFPLRNLAPEGAGAPYYLPYALPYGIVNLIIAGLGVFFTTNAKEKPGLYFPGFIIGIVAGGLLTLEALPIGIFLHNVEFCISVAVIGACVIAIAITGLKALKGD